LSKKNSSQNEKIVSIRKFQANKRIISPKKEVKIKDVKNSTELKTVIFFSLSLEARGMNLKKNYHDRFQKRNRKKKLRSILEKKTSRRTLD